VLGIAALGAVAGAEPPTSPPPHKIALTNVADRASVAPFQDIGFTLTVSNSAQFTLHDVHLTDALPAATNLSEVVDGQRREWLRSVGAVGTQSISCRR